MENSIKKSIKIVDVRGRKIIEGAMVRYVGTDTTGKVNKIRIREDIPWVRIESTELFYRSDYSKFLKMQQKIKNRRNMEWNLLKRELED